MSVSAADINNDLHQDLFIAQIAEIVLPEGEMTTNADSICNCYQNTDYWIECINIINGRSRIRSAVNLERFNSLTDEEKDAAYKVYLLKTLVRRVSLGKEIDSSLSAYAQTLEKWQYLHADSNIYSEYNYLEMEGEHFIKQKNKHNFLFINDGNELLDSTDQFNLKKGGWTWNAQFEDLNNDEYVDLYIVNGSGAQMADHMNFFYLNQKGKSFKEVGAEVNLKSFMPTQSYTYFDFDNDGDMDIAALSELGAVMFYKNNLNKGNSIQFELTDHKGNLHGVGAKVYIYYGENGEKNQMRELRLSGGYQSYNPLVAHFGMNNYNRVHHVEVVWNDGEVTTINKSLEVGNKYWVTIK
jgi:hypothetical protein